MTNRFLGTVSESGELQLRNRVGYEGILKHLARKQPCEVVLTIARRSKPRSLSQNAYFHGPVCTLISEHTGYESEEVKEILKQMFLLVAEPYPHARPTSSLNTAEMAEFTDRCIRWAAIELGVVIPTPEERGL